MNAALASEGPLRWAMESARLPSWFLYFLVVSLAAAFVTSALKLSDPRRIARECAKTFGAIVLGILALSGVLLALEWIFVRPLLQ